MKVRVAERSDIDAIAFVHVASWRSTYRGLVPDDFLAGLSVERRKEAWTEIVESTASDSSDVLVLEDADTVVGFSHYSPSRDEDADPSTGEITSIYLLASHWRRGGGSLLLETAKDALRLRGFETATLWVLDDTPRSSR